MSHKNRLHQLTDLDICNFCKSRTALVPAIMIGVATLSACQQLRLLESTPPPAAAVEPQTPPISSEPIAMSIPDIKFAQTALNSLSYGAGEVDGLWGPRSERAILNFEKDNNLTTANGRLSELNLATLERISRILRKPLTPPKQDVKRSISAKLNPQTLQQEVPQLIITEQPYPIMLRANPYSEVITTLPPGTGLYILNLQSGWFEVESTDNLRGFIKAE